MIGLRERFMKKIPAARRLLLLILCSTFSYLPKISLALTTITNTKFIQDGQDAETLVSQGEIFELGFFNPSNSTKNRYLGMWYKKISTQTVVWVANRENPLNDSTGILKIGDDGNLVLIDGSSRVLWSTNISKVGYSVVQLMESGNLVLKEESDGTILWQSFDHPSDTLLPGMKLGWDLKTGLDRFLTSWKSPDDPSPGDFTFKLDIHGSPQLLLSQGSDLLYRSGPWNGIRFSGVPEMDSKGIFTFGFVDNQDEIYYSFQVMDSSYVSRLLVNSTGQLQRITSLDQEDGNWNLFWWAPKDQCDKYEVCGPYGICNTDDSPVCICAHGFQPKSPEEWFLRDASGGCMRREALNCPSGDGFLKLEGMKLPDTANAFVDEGMSLEKCKDECFSNCSCMAYAAANISSGEGTGCIIWSADLIDLRQYTTSGQDLYVRLAASDLDTGNSGKKKTIIAITVSIAFAIFLLTLGCISFRRWKRQKKKKMSNRLTRTIGSRERSQDFPMLDVVASSGPDSIDEGRAEDLELPLFDLGTIISATDNFSEENKLGEGGFGPVYKGKLLEGQEIAVKRLSKKSGQGLGEFKNEVRLIAKLQHRNLVRLLGWCIKGEEKMLIYEYMQNRSLDSIIFNQTKSPLLDWPKRFNIIMGIARGLLYLHQDSRFRIIHRDLKVSNVLLDSQMNPKISDFGMARIFGGDQTEANTVKVVGTFGYMAPEYAMDGVISVKSDVFSFGVIVLEILSGKKNRGFYHEDHHLNLLGHVWRLWKEGRAEEVTDPAIGIRCSMSEFMRCLQVGLLCVQERAEDRPTMSTAVLMLGSENPTLPQPKQPGFSTGRSYFETDSSSSKQPVSFTVNEMSVTMVEGR